VKVTSGRYPKHFSFILRKLLYIDYRSLQANSACILTIIMHVGRHRYKLLQLSSTECGFCCVSGCCIHLRWLTTALPLQSQVVVQLIIEILVYLLIFLLLLNRFCSLPINNKINGFCAFFERGFFFLANMPGILTRKVLSARERNFWHCVFFTDRYRARKDRSRSTINLCPNVLCFSSNTRYIL